MIEKSSYTKVSSGLRLEPSPSPSTLEPARAGPSPSSLDLELLLWNLSGL